MNRVGMAPDSNRYISSSPSRCAPSMAASMGGKKRRPSTSSSKRLPWRQGNRYLPGGLSRIKEVLIYMIVNHREHRDHGGNRRISARILCELCVLCGWISYFRGSLIRTSLGTAEVRLRFFSGIRQAGDAPGIEAGVEQIVYPVLVHAVQAAHLDHRRGRTEACVVFAQRFDHLPVRVGKLD